MMSSAANLHGMESTLEALTLLAAKSKVNQEAIIREKGVQIIVQVRVLPCPRGWVICFTCDLLHIK